MIGALVALAGGLGALARVEISGHLRGHTDLWATRLVNVLGTAMLALLVASDLDATTSKVLATGFLGGFTTFSTWMLEASDQHGAQRSREVAIPIAVGLAIAVAIRWLA